MNVDDRISVVAVIDGASSVCAATVVGRDQTVLHVSTDEPLPLPVGNVVGLTAHGTDPLPSSGGGGIVALALVAESVGPNITALRVLERRS